MIDQYKYLQLSHSQRRQLDAQAYANALANDLAVSRWLMAANAVEDPRSRAARLLSDARARHPEWTVKKLQKPC